MPIIQGSINSKYMSGIGMPVVGVAPQIPALYGFARPPISAIQTYDKFTGKLGPKIDLQNNVNNFVDQFNTNIANQTGIKLPQPSPLSIQLGQVTTQTYSNGKINLALAGTEKDIIEAINILNAHYGK